MIDEQSDPPRTATGKLIDAYTQHTYIVVNHICCALSICGAFSVKNTLFQDWRADRSG